MVIILMISKNLVFLRIHHSRFFQKGTAPPRQSHLMIFEISVAQTLSGLVPTLRSL